MPHRDELDALRARLESQEKDLSDARAELDVLRAAVHQQASVNAASAHPPPPGAMGFGPGAFPSPSGAPDVPGPSGLRPTTQRQIGSLMILTSLLVGGLLMATTVCHRARGSCGTRARMDYGPGAAAAMPAPEAYAPVWSPFVRFGHVSAPSAGEVAVVAEGTACAVEVTPAEGGADLDCRIVVRCGDRVLYGEDSTTGYAACGVVPSRVVDGNTTDRDGDPAMTLDLASGTVTIEERAGLSMQRVQITLDPITGS